MAVPINNYTLSDIKEALGDNTITVRNIQGALLHKSNLIDGRKLDPKYCPGGSAIGKLNSIKQTIGDGGEFNMGYWRNYGNIFNFPVNLIVTNGTPSGSYLSEDVIDISAIIPDGKSFDRWEHVTEDDSIVEDSNNSITAITLGEIDTEIIAIFAVKYILEIINGTGSTLAVEGSVIEISANTPEGYYFKEWVGDITNITIGSVNDSIVSITMPNNNTQLTATFLPYLTLTVNDGIIL